MRLPIWFVVKERTANGVRSIPCNDSGEALGFTKTENLIAFLSGECRQELEIDLASAPEELVMLVADLHTQGATQLCLDPERDGNGGRKVVALSDVLAFAERQKAESNARWQKHRSAK
jgi:hypothetical protein